jgi:hypothetical protein
MTYVIIGVIILFIILFQIGKTKQKNDPENGLTIKVQTDSSSKKDTNRSKWEKVQRKTERWTDLGFGDGDSFPGYGKLYDREIKVWYCDVGKKEIKDEQIIQDRFPLNYEPKNSTKITGEGVYLDRLDNTKGYEYLFTGLDKKNRKRWYFALVKSTPTWIETGRASEKENVKVKKEDVVIPKGWVLVRNQSKKWNELGYNRNRPGYGKVYEITLDIWYSVVGSKEKIEQPSFSVNLTLNGERPSPYYLNQSVCNKIEELNGKQLNFERLSRPQGYLYLYNGLESATKKRWYLGIREIKPTYVFTESVE